MFKSTTKTLALALVAGSLLAGIATTPSFARDGGGSDRPRAHACHHANCKHVNRIKKVAKKKVAKKARKGRGVSWASSYDPDTGRRITAIDNGDRTRTVIGIGAGFGPFGIQIWQSN